MPGIAFIPAVILAMVPLVVLTDGQYSSVGSATDERDVCFLCLCSDGGSSVVCSTEHLNVSQDSFAGINLAPGVTSLSMTGIFSANYAALGIRGGLLGKYFPNLHSLSFDLWNITNIEDDAFDQMPYLQELSFYKNDLREIPSKALKLVGKYLAKLEITDQRSLEIVKSNALQDLYNLTSLDLSSNNIHHLENGALMGLGKLKVMSLSGNNIDTIDESVFGSLLNLTTLDLSINHLHVIPASIYSLVQLEELDLSHNSISVNNNSFYFVNSMPNLKSLDLRSNAISLVDEFSVDIFTNSSLITIRLCDNPYVCNQKLCSFMLTYRLYLYWSLPFDDYTSGLTIECTYSCSYPFRYLGHTFDNVFGELCLAIPTASSGPLEVEKNMKSVRVIGIVMGVLTVSGVVFGFVVFLALRRLRRLRQGFIFAGQGFINFNNERNPDIRFDALVYNHINENHFVDDRLRPRLEDPPKNFHLCLPLTRDFRLGAKKLNNLRESMIASRCAIFVISEAFVQDARCKQALEVACELLHRDDLGPPHLKQTGLILIVMDPVLLDRLPETLRVLVDRLVTLEWENLNEERCWQRLEQTLIQLREPDEI